MPLDIILEKSSCKAFDKYRGTFLYQSFKPYGGNLKDFAN